MQTLIVGDLNRVPHSFYQLFFLEEEEKEKTTVHVLNNTCLEECLDAVLISDSLQKQPEISGLKVPL